MTPAHSEKILLLPDLIDKVAELKAAGKTVVLTHGVFDIIHPGIIQHLNESRDQGDVLIATVIQDRDVRRGPGRPVFPDTFRATSVASLSQVDYVCIVDDAEPFSCIRRIAPHVFSKGKAYKERDRAIHQKLFEEEKDLFAGKIRIQETSGFSFSSSRVINDFLDIYPEEVRAFLRRFGEKHDFDAVRAAMDKLSRMNVLVVGDGIVDEYHYTKVMGKAGKANLVVHRHLTHEVFAGGSFAVANHLAGICRGVTLATVLGADDSREAFVTDALKPGVTPAYFTRPDAPTVIKKRYIDEYSNQKLFEVNYLSEENIPAGTEAELAAFVREKASDFDLVLVCDFGHGMVTPAIIEALEESAPVLAVNTQTNAANKGFNLITKYSRAGFVCLDEGEARLAMQDKTGEITALCTRLKDTIGADGLIVTLGKRGATGIGRDGAHHPTPIFSSRVIDTVGAGDAFFSFAAPLFAAGAPMELIVFVGNAVGALAVQTMCNRESVERSRLLEFIHTLLNRNND